MFVRPHGAPCAAQVCQPGVERLLAVDRHPHRQRVDEQPEHVLDAGHRLVPARPGRAEHDLAFVAVVMQHQRPGALHERVHRHALRDSKRLERGGLGRFECARDLLMHAFGR